MESRQIGLQVIDSKNAGVAHAYFLGNDGFWDKMFSDIPLFLICGDLLTTWPTKVCECLQLWTTNPCMSVVCFSLIDRSDEKFNFLQTLCHNKTGLQVVYIVCYD